ncbi:MAG: CHASE domain-containing protein [Burkholderiales bacterium]|nr:CHASE domain-containing protein [Burkholderiales bacterium]
MLNDRIEHLSHPLAILVTLTLALGLTYTGWQSAVDGTTNEARSRFEARASRVSDILSGRMLDYEQVLRGAGGLFAASASVERETWRAYIASLRIEKAYPGIQALAFARRVHAGDRAGHERDVRNEGFPAYAIHPEGNRDEYFPTVFIEPFEGRNLRAFGYDTFSEPVRRATMERARDTGNAALSERLTLVQENGGDAQPGILMYLPVYDRVTAADTEQRRQAGLIGYVIAAFRMDDLMRGLMREDPGIRLQIHDDGTPSQPGTVLYDSLRTAAGSAGSHLPRFSAARVVQINDRQWLLQVESLPAFEATVSRAMPRIVLVSGIVISLMLTVIIWSLSSLRQRATALARRMTGELRESREQLGLAIEGSDLALFDWDVASGRVELSERWQAMLGGGRAPVETTITALEALVHPEDRPALGKQLRDVLKGSIRFYEAEHRVRNLHGEWKWILSRAKVVQRDRDGKALRVTGTNADITERKEVERMKNEFIATVSHELRTPLTALIGALGLLREGGAGRLPESATAFVDMAYQNGERLAALVNDILDLEKIESGRMHFRMEPVDVAEFLAHAAHINAPYAEKLGVRFELNHPLPDARISTDRDRLLQVVTNLLSNAAKFSPAGEAVTVSAGIRDGRLRVGVADRGPGVPHEFRDRIFDKFAQADGSDTRQKGGTGLGLSICKAIVEKLGGKIGFDSSPGSGATFYFELPLENTSR